jgi:hypothetical protein
MAAVASVAAFEDKFVTTGPMAEGKNASLQVETVFPPPRTSTEVIFSISHEATPCAALSSFARGTARRL